MTAPQLLNLHSQTAKPACALVLDAIGLGEGARLEFKNSFQKEVAKTLAAFANTRGGSILVGVGDSGQIIGVAIQPETVQGWVNQCKQNTSPKRCSISSSPKTKRSSALISEQ